MATEVNSTVTSARDLFAHADEHEEMGLPLNVRSFGAIGDGVTDDTAAIQACINHAETLIEAITTNYDLATGLVRLGPGRFKHNGLLLSQTVDGVCLVGDGMGVTSLEYAGNGVGIKVGTESGAPNFAHVWVRDLTIRGGSPAFTTNDAHIVAGSIGIQFNRMIRGCGMERCQVFGHDTNVQLKDCWTFKIRDNHIHDAGVNHVHWQTALNGELTGNRFDDSGSTGVIIDAQGASNQIRDFRVVGNTFQESEVGALIFYDVSSAWVESNHFENNNQSDAGVHREIEFLLGTDARPDGTLTLCDNYYSPGAATWTGTERAVYVEAARHVQCIGEKTGSSAFNTYIEVGANVQHVTIDGGVFTNLPTTNAVTRASTNTTLQECWTRMDGDGVIVETVNRWTYKSRSNSPGLGLNHVIATTTGSLATNSERTFFNMAGNNQTLTLSTSDEMEGRAIFVRKYSTSGTLTVDPEGATQVSLNGSTNNTAVLAAARGGCWFVFDGTVWVCMPTDEAGGWALAA